MILLLYKKENVANKLNSLTDISTTSIEKEPICLMWYQPLRQIFVYVIFGLFQEEI